MILPGPIELLPAGCCPAFRALLVPLGMFHQTSIPGRRWGSGYQPASGWYGPGVAVGSLASRAAGLFEIPLDEILLI
jgi:hypothetical protein